MIIDDMISTGHARALISIEDPEQQYTIAQKVFDEKLSVRDVEKLVKNLNKPEKEKKEAAEDKSLEIIYRDVEEKLRQSLGTKVSISSKGNGSGKLEIEFYNHDDLDKIIELLSSGK
jgi:ParB family chromosome partitioning protein